MPNCDSCGGVMGPTNDLLEAMNWRLNPLGFAALLAYHGEIAITGKSYAHQYRCSKCNTYKLTCGSCHNDYAISSRKRQNEAWKCECGAMCRVVAV